MKTGVMGAVGSHGGYMSRAVSSGVGRKDQVDQVQQGPSKVPQPPGIVGTHGARGVVPFLGENELWLGQRAVMALFYCFFLLGRFSGAAPVPMMGMGMLRPSGIPQAQNASRDGCPCPMLQVRR